MYRECTKEPYYFLKNDTTLLASDPLRFRKKLFLSYKNILAKFELSKS